MRTRGRLIIFHSTTLSYTRKRRNISLLYRYFHEKCSDEQYHLVALALTLTDKTHHAG